MKIYVKEGNDYRAVTERQLKQLKAQEKRIWRMRAIKTIAMNLMIQATREIEIRQNELTELREKQICGVK